jgi:prolipoprotein diacylglyceryl transferase
MYPTLSDLIFDLTGLNIPLPIQSFGLMMAVAFLAAAWLLHKELKRKYELGLIPSTTLKIEKGKPASSGEIFFSAFIGFILGYKIIYALLNYDAFVEDTQGTLLSLKGNVFGGILTGAFFGWFKYREKEKNKTDKPFIAEEKVAPQDLTGSITIVAAVSGIIGAKLFHNLENPDELMSDPVDALLSFSGLTMYGGLICATFAVLWYGKKHKIPPLQLCDATAPGLMLAYAIGRVGCQLAGDGDWGIVNMNAKPSFWFLPDWTWAFTYPHNVISEGVPIAGCEGKHCYELLHPVYPTPFYEAVICTILFIPLWVLRKKISIPGKLFAIYLILNGVERFFIEKIRVNEKYHIAGYEITQAEIISVVLFITGLMMFYILNRKKRVA